MSPTRLAVVCEVGRLLEPESVLSPSKTSEHPPRARNFTVSESIGVATQHKDHMHGVVALLRLAPPSVDLTGDDETDQDPLVAASPRHRGANHHRLQSESRPKAVKKKIFEPSDTSNPSRNTTIHLNTVRQRNSTAVRNPRSKSERNSFKPFPFMHFPPEIRNSIYTILLTTPNVPIEFPGLTGQNAARHRAQWAKCTTTDMRRRHKKLFLEVLATCRQVHDEASGIIYGCNVFKYRINPDEGRKSVVLPTRHLQLLKHIKISVVSRHAQNGQREWVADLIKQFVKEGLRMKTFELTWYGWARYPLMVTGPICQALRLLQVSESFVVKIAGEARMEKAMQEQLKESLSSKKVEIQRPVRAITGEELSENEAW